MVCLMQSGCHTGLVLTRIRPGLGLDLVSALKVLVVCCHDLVLVYMFSTTTLYKTYLTLLLSFKGLLIDT